MTKKNNKENKERKKQSDILRLSVKVKNDLLGDGAMRLNSFDIRLGKVISALLEVMNKYKVIKFLLTPDPYFDGLQPIDLVGSEWAMNKTLLPYISQLKFYKRPKK